jgi:cation transport ATPase
MIASLNQYSEHPQAVVNFAKAKRLLCWKRDFESITGKVVGTVNGKKIAWK